MNCRSLLPSLLALLLAPSAGSAQVSSSTPASPGDPQVLEPVEVTGSRIRSVLGEATANPVITYTREDFDRLGIATLQDFNTYIPQLPTIAWESTPETGYVNLANDGGRTNFNGGLRTLGNTATLILVNGRRVPKLGTATGSDSYDFGGVPISSIERVEVLTDGASAVYGADAMAGVINIILKKEYRGTQLRATYANTFNSDTANREVQLSSGWRTGRLTLNTTLGWSKTGALSPRDRWFMASNDRRWLGGTDGRANIPAGPGVIRTSNGQPFPGTTSNNLKIPAEADGVTTTAAQFIAAGPWDGTDRFDQPQYQVYGDRQSRNARLQGEYELNPRVSAFFDGTWKKDQSFRPGDYRTIAITNIPAGYPGNPFPVAITLQRVFWEMAKYLETDLETDIYSGLVGLRGRLARGWRWEAGLQHQRSAYSVTGLGGGGTFTTASINALVTNPAIRPILLNDGLSNSPNSPEVMRAMLFYGNYGERPTTWNYDAKADGPVWSLPAGDIQAAVGVERREEYATFRVSPTDPFGRLKTAVERSSNSAFAEVQVPIASDKKRWPGLYKASVNFSARRDDYSDFGAGTVPRTSAIWHPFKPLALRASLGKGYKAPNLSSVYAPVVQSTVSIGAIAGVVDTKRGGELVTGPVQQISGGSRDLKAERSENRNYGALLEVPFVKGLSLGVDYYEIDQTDRVGGSLALIVPNYEFRLQRAAPSPADIAKGWPGLVTTIDVRPLNLASIRTAGLDYQARYFRRFDRLGDFNVRLTANKPKVSKTQSAPNQGIVNNLPGGYWRGTGVLTWSRRAWSLGGTATYTSRYIGRYFPGGTYFNNGTVNKPITLWDAQAGYDFAQGRWQPTGWLRHAFRDLRVSVNVYNLLGKEPALDPVSKAPILGTIDPRGRRFQATLTKKL
jgi:outer membrane receptor protein involved in Fe transport